MKAGNVETRRAAIIALSTWPNAGPLDDLLDIAVTTTDAKLRVLALRGVANLVPAAGDRSAEQRVEILRKAIGLTNGGEELKPILSALGKVPSPASARLAAGYSEQFGPA